MELISFNCPNCGAPVHIEADKDTCYCPNCGSQLYKDDPNKKTFVFIDKAKIAETESNERIRHAELQHQSKLDYVKIAAIIIALIVLYLVLTNHDVQVVILLVSLIGIPVAGIVALFYFLFR